MTKPDSKVLGIITVVQEASDAVRRQFKLRADPTDSHRGYWIGKVDIPTGATMEVVECQTSDRSNIPAAVTTYQLIQDKRPDYIFLVDIGGAFLPAPETAEAEAVLLGDVVVATHIHYYEYLKEMEGGETRLRRFSQQQPDSQLLATARHLAGRPTGSWWTADRLTRPSEPPLFRAQPVVRLGELLAGEKLLADKESSTFTRLGSFDKAIAVDMESAGVSHALAAGVRHRRGIGFMVFRGVSDYCDGPGNQKTRDAWKAYACETAASCAYGFVLQSDLLTTWPEVEGFYRPAVEAILRAGSPTVEFPLRMSVVGTDDVERSVSPVELLELGQLGPRVHIACDAGRGKTELLRQVALLGLTESKALPVLIPLKGFREDDWGRLTEIERLAPEDRVALLLRCSAVLMNTAMLSILSQHPPPPMFLVDGLNEVPGHVVDHLVATLDALPQLFPGARVLVADRNQSRSAFSAEWQRASIAPLTDAAVASIVVLDPGTSILEKELLRIPYFLNEALVRMTTRLSSVRVALASFFTEGLRLDAKDIATIAATACLAYIKFGSRIFNLGWAAKSLGEKLARQLLDTGVIKRTGTSVDAQFSHQLQHDFLAAQHLVDHSDLWSGEIFERVTFGTNSTQVVDFVLGAIQSSVLRDQVVRQLYDWNWSLAVGAAAGSGASGIACTTELQIAMAALNLEKRLDTIPHTREAAARVGRFPSELAESVQASRTLDEGMALLAAVELGSEWFSPWRDLFTGSCSRELIMAAVAGSDALSGWTAANSLRRRPDVADLFDALVDVTNQHGGRGPHERSVRWRIVHVLGRIPTPSAVDVLLSSLSDPDGWVQYGAARALIEIVCSTPSLRTHTLDAMASRMEKLQSNVCEEACRASLDSRATAGWAEAARPFIERIRQYLVSRGERAAVERVGAILARMERSQP